MSALPSSRSTRLSSARFVQKFSLSLCVSPPMLVFDPEIIDQGNQFLTQDAPELLKVLEEGLSTLRQLPPPSFSLQIHGVMEAVRAIGKGAAVIDLHDIQAIAQRFEAVLQKIQVETVEIDENLEGLLFQAYDRLRSPLVQEIKTGQHSDRSSLHLAEGAFTQLEAHLTKILQQEPESSDPASNSEADPKADPEADDWHDTLTNLEELLGDEGAGITNLVPPIPPEYQPYSEKKQSLPNAEVPVVSLHPDENPRPNLRAESPTLVDRLSDRLQTARIYPTPNITNTVRVDLHRLEKLNNLIGELFIQETGSVLQIQQLQDRLQSLSQRFKNFEQFTKELHNYAHRSSSSKSKLSQTPYFLPQIGFASSHPDFDPLQMDSYSHLYTLAQAMSEEIAQLGETMLDTTLLCHQAQSTQQRRQQTVKQIRGGLLKTRMFPVGEILQRFPRMVRDLSAQYHKQVAVKLSGTTTLMDKAVLEKLLDPMVHLVRNAFDHGVDLPADRAAQNKPTEATIEIRAYHRGNQTYIEVRDDGKGIDVEAVRSKVVAKGLATETEARAMTRDRLYEYLFSPGFSTAAKVSELSGRGVGLDVVQEQVRNLKGTITLSSEPGKGTTFTLRLPLTLTIAKLLVFSIQSNLMAIPVESLVSIATAAPEQLVTEDDQQFYCWNQKQIPLCSQAAFLFPHLPSRGMGDRLPIPLPLEDKVPLLLIAAGSKTIALQVDQILQEQELVIKPFGRAVKAPAHLYGCTILGDGSLVPVLDGLGLMATGETFAVPLQPMRHRVAVPQIPTVLVVDDSLTVRQSMVFTLEKAGYRVLQARDGRDGMAQLHQEPDVQAVFCDVEMPRMNGFEFLSQCRQDFAEAAPPVIMLTSRGGDKHRQTAQELGASSYLTKPYLEQDLLKTLQGVLAAQPKRSSVPMSPPENQLVEAH
jgi:chemotaxis protein histidine kinase CheA/CheY-like chemotaxis protein